MLKVLALSHAALRSSLAVALRAVPVGRAPAPASLSSLVTVSGKAERQAARKVVAAYHEAELGELVARVGEAVDRYRAGELDAFDVDRVLLQYSRAAKELWKYCNYGSVELAAEVIRARPPLNWWEQGAPRQRS